MIPTLAMIVLGLSPTMAGPPIGARSSAVATLDYTASLYASGPTAGQMCTGAAITTDQSGAISVTRATSATCERAAGDLVTITSNLAVVETEGLRVEAASSNRVAYSEAITTQWTATNVTTGASSITDPLGGTATALETTSSGGRYESAAFTITGTSAVLSIFISGDDGQTSNVVLRDTTAGADRCTISSTATVAWPAMASRNSCNSAAIVSGNNHVVRIYPGGTAGATGAAVYFWGAQVEPGITVKSSYIQTTGTAATRNADNISTTVAAANTEGCFSTTFYAATAAFPTTIASNPATLANFGGTTTMLANDGTNTATSNSVSSMSGRSETVRLIWSGSSMQIGLAGSMGTAATFDGTMSGGLTTLYLGSLSGTSRHLGGWIKKLKFGTLGTGCAL